MIEAKLWKERLSQTTLKCLGKNTPVDVHDDGVTKHYYIEEGAHKRWLREGFYHEMLALFGKENIYVVSESGINGSEYFVALNSRKNSYSIMLKVIASYEIVVHSRLALFYSPIYKHHEGDYFNVFPELKEELEEYTDKFLNWVKSQNRYRLLDITGGLVVHHS